VDWSVSCVLDVPIIHFKAQGSRAVRKKQEIGKELHTTVGDGSESEYNS